MKLRTQRLKLTWLLAVPFLIISRPSTGLLLMGGGLAIVGLLLRGWAAGSIHKDRSLATTGPYGHLRHPLYVGSFLIGVGLVVAGGRWFLAPPFLALFVWVYGRTVRSEEGEMDRRFPDSHKRYRRGVPRFVPRLRPYAPDGETPEAGLMPGGSHPPSIPTGERSEVPLSFPDLPRRATGFRLALFRRNKEWQAGFGVGVGFGLLCLKAMFFG